MTARPVNSFASTNERVWAVIAHLSAVAMGMGLLLPVVGWSESRRKSNYASFQCMQALGYQSLGYTIWLLGMLVIMVFAGLVGAVSVTQAKDFQTELMKITFTHMFLLFGLFGLYLVLPVIGAISCALGRDFRYPFMGNRLANYLGYEHGVSSDDEQAWLIEGHEDRWVVAMGHLVVIVPFFGMLVPITAWIMEGKRSAFLKFQSAQTVVFQVIAFLMPFVSSLFYFAGFVFLLVTMGLANVINAKPVIVLIGFGGFVLSMLGMFVVLLLTPLLHIAGQWAGYRTLTGHEYRYPLVGKWVEKRIAVEKPVFQVKESE